jgi:ketosteroid isomerase-like protein
VSTAENKDLIRRIFAGLEIGDGRLLFESMRSDFCWIIPGSTKWSRIYEGKHVVANELMRPLRRKIEGAIKTKAHRIVADGDLVVVEARGDNITKAGEPYCNTYCFVFRVEGGKLKEVTEYQDTELAARVLGEPGE